VGCKKVRSKRARVEILGFYCRVELQGKRFYIPSHDAVRLYRYCMKAKKNKTKAWINTIDIRNNGPAYIELKGRDIKSYIKSWRENVQFLKLRYTEEPWEVFTAKKFNGDNLIVACHGFVDEEAVLAVILFGALGVYYSRHIVAVEDIEEVIEDRELQRIAYEHYVSPITRMMALLFG